MLVLNRLYSKIVVFTAAVVLLEKVTLLFDIFYGRKS